MSEENKNDKVNEPPASYFKKAELRVYYSFEEQEEDQRRMNGQLSPEQRMRQLNRLIRMSLWFKDIDLDKLQPSNNIYF